VTGRSDPAAARALYDESLALHRALGHDFGTGVVLNALAGLARDAGGGAAARRLYEELLAIERRLGNARGLAIALHNLGAVAHRAGDPEQAAAHYAQGLTLFRDVGDRHGMAWCLAGLAAAAAATGQGKRAARLLGAAAPHLGAGAAPLHPAGPADRGGTPAAVRAAPGDRAFDAAWAEGRATPLEEAVEDALAGVGPRPPAPPAGAAGASPPPAPHPPASDGGAASRRSATAPLTRREHEVAALVAQGLTNRQIAARLVVTERTAGTHLERIMNKLGAHSRAQVAAWAAEHRLAGAPAPAAADGAG
jgi:DNA-binding CsgD family transcriptional regulator